MQKILRKLKCLCLFFLVTAEVSFSMAAGVKTPAAAPIHIEDPVGLSMAKMIESRREIELLVASGRLQHLHNELILMDTMLASARKEVDEKLVLNGGPTANYAGRTTEIIGRLEAIRTLVRIALGFSSPFYSFPDGHIPDSVNNALKAAHDESELLLKNIDEWSKTEKVKE